MARPRKYGDQRMDIQLRIPVTGEQKALIDEVTADEPEGMAAWARDPAGGGAAQGGKVRK